MSAADSGLAPGPEAELRITDNPELQRYEAHLGDELAGFSTYRLKPEKIVFVHTEVMPEFEGHGVGSGLARAALDDARTRGLLIVPLCPFIAAYIKRHPAYADLVAPRRSGR
jgi:predicted GNAT family acetyltransferase